MKITSIDFKNSNGDPYLTLSFKDPSTNNPYIVKTIVGLDTEEIVPRFYGNQFFELIPNKRTVVARISLNPNFQGGQSYSSLRDNVYRSISASRLGLTTLSLKQEEDEIATISGFVTKVEALHFDKLPEIQVTVECSDGLFKAPSRVLAPVSFADQSKPVVVDELSTAPHGGIFVFQFNQTVSSFTIQDVNETDWSFQVHPSSVAAEVGFRNNDVLYISSEINNRYVRVLRSGTVYNIAGDVSPGSVWPNIFPGENLFSSSDEGQWVAIEHFPHFWGV